MKASPHWHTFNPHQKSPAPNRSHAREFVSFFCLPHVQLSWFESLFLTERRRRSQLRSRITTKSINFNLLQVVKCLLTISCRARKRSFVTCQGSLSLINIDSVNSCRWILGTRSSFFWFTNNDVITWGVGDGKGERGGIDFEGDSCERRL